MPDDYSVTPIKSGVILEWEQIKIEVSNIQPRTLGAMGEISISCCGHVLDRSFMNVMDTNKGLSLQRKMVSLQKEPHGKGTSWASYINLALLHAKKAFEEENPIIPLEELMQVKKEFSWVCRPFLAAGLPTILFGPGGTGKSKFALWLAMLIQNGISVAPHIHTPSAQNCLYLDWESDPPDAGYLAQGLRTGNPEIVELPLYRRCEQPIIGEIQHLWKMIVEKHVAVIIVDSLALASGGDAMLPETAISFFRSVRFLGCHAIILAHPPKHAVEGEEGGQVFGSTFFQNLTRSVWEMQHAIGSDHIVGLFHRKCNYWKPFRPQCWKLNYEQEPWSIALVPHDLYGTSLEERLPLGDRIEHLISMTVGLSAKDIAMELWRDEKKWKKIWGLMNADNRFDCEAKGKPEDAAWFLSSKE